MQKHLILHPHKSEIAMRYCLEYFPNPEMAVLHLGKKVFEKRISTDPLMAALERGESGEKKPGQEIVDDLMKIEGILSVTVSPYEVHISKAKVFLWSELKAPILECISKIDGTLEEVQRPSSFSREKIYREEDDELDDEFDEYVDESEFVERIDGDAELN